MNYLLPRMEGSFANFIRSTSRAQPGWSRDSGKPNTSCSLQSSHRHGRLCTKYYACLTGDIFRHRPPLATMVLSATRTYFKPMQSPEFMVCCFCNKPTKALSASLVQARFAHPECYAKHVKARSKEIPAARKATCSSSVHGGVVERRNSNIKGVSSGLGRAEYPLADSD
jgi:hypothetical protein